MTNFNCSSCPFVPVCATDIVTREDDDYEDYADDDYGSGESNFSLLIPYDDSFELSPPWIEEDDLPTHSCSGNLSVLSVVFFILGCCGEILKSWPPFHLTIPVWALAS